MKRKLWTTLFVMILSLMLVIPAQAEAQLDNVTDAAGILTEAEWQALEQQARDISQQYGVGTYIITLDDYQNYTDGDIYDAADAIYEEYTLGMGEGRDGILLMLSMADRDYLLIAYGEQAKYAFNEAGREYLDDFFLDDFGKDAWNDGFAEYLHWSADYLDQAQKGEPYGEGNAPMSDAARSKAIRNHILIILLVPLAAAFIDRSNLKSKLKSVEQATEADHYMTGTLKLIADHDLFTHMTEERTVIERKSDKSTSSDSDGGGSGTSGKF